MCEVGLNGIAPQGDLFGVVEDLSIEPTSYYFQLHIMEFHTYAMFENLVGSSSERVEKCLELVSPKE